MKCDNCGDNTDKDFYGKLCGSCHRQESKPPEPNRSDYLTIAKLTGQIARHAGHGRPKEIRISYEQALQLRCDQTFFMHPLCGVKREDAVCMIEGVLVTKGLPPHPYTDDCFTKVKVDRTKINFPEYVYRQSFPSSWTWSTPYEGMTLDEIFIQHGTTVRDRVEDVFKSSFDYSDIDHGITRGTVPFTHPSEESYIDFRMVFDEPKAELYLSGASPCEASLDLLIYRATLSREACNVVGFLSSFKRDFSVLMRRIAAGENVRGMHPDDQGNEIPLA